MFIFNMLFKIVSPLLNLNCAQLLNWFFKRLHYI